MAQKHKLSKRHSLSKLAPDWREKIFASIKSEWLKQAVAVLSATGCRACELEKGIGLRFVDGDIRVGIRGAKVDLLTKRGQPYRILTIDPTTSWGAYLLEKILLTENNGLVVQYDAGGISQRLREKSKELWPRRKSLVSANSYRHYIAKSMKESGEDGIKIAATLGHASDFSQMAYGRAGGKKLSADQHGILDAKAINPIRHSPKVDKIAVLLQQHQLIKSEG
jgi:integrase